MSGPYAVGVIPCATREEAKRVFAQIVDQTDHFSGEIPVIQGSDGLTICVTGTGKEGRANALMLAGLLNLSHEAGPVATAAQVQTKPSQIEELLLAALETVHAQPGEALEVGRNKLARALEGAGVALRSSTEREAQLYVENAYNQGEDIECEVGGRWVGVDQTGYSIDLHGFMWHQFQYRIKGSGQ